MSVQEANDKYLTISTLTQYIKRKFDLDPYLDQVFLKGELSNFRLRPNHQYFSLKDAHAKIDAVMFKSDFKKVKFMPETGMQVLAVGRISVYEPTGNYQVYIKQLVPDGLGNLYLAYTQLKEKLSKEGIFSQEKRALAKFPKRIAVITSPSGAVIRDIITTVRRRYPIAQLVLFPAVVQGDQAKDSLVGRLKQVNLQGDFDTIIIGRGGGSLEDLWPFNEESVVRAIAESKIPIISSVGHETDTTLSDLAADVRAATPTAAAELATPVLEDTLLNIQKSRLRLIQNLRQRLSVAQDQVQRVTQSYVLKQPQRLYENYNQRLDLAKTNLLKAMTAALQVQQQRFAQTKQRLALIKLDTKCQQQRQSVAKLKVRLIRHMERYMAQQRQQVRVQIQGLDHLSPLKILGRGYSYTTKADQIVNSVTQVQSGEPVQIHLKDGQVNAVVNSIEKGEDNG